MVHKIYTIAFALVCICATCKAQFVTVKGNSFFIQNKKYIYTGTNYWYGAYLYSDTKHNGKERVIHELDFLQKQGITNLRVMVTSEGDASYVYRIFPSLQPTQHVFNETILVGLDYLLFEMKKRNMKAIMVLNNNWEWSGGFGQYLEWNNYGVAPLPKTSLWDWDAYCTYIAKFYTCISCQQLYQATIEKIVNRVNTYTYIAYKNDPTIMSWELANEPRPMKNEAIEDFKLWIKNTAAYIKQLDKNHLVTTGSEGLIGCFNQQELYTYIHNLQTIDYATIHIWPKTWQWYKGITTEQSTTDTTLQKTKNYIQTHVSILKKINKPLVIEEFGLHRDGNSFDSKRTTAHRDIYYKMVFEEIKKYNIAGYNFWGYAGVARKNNTGNDFWQQGMAYSADPPQEEQGLYSVFETDTSTWNVIKKYSIKK